MYGQNMMELLALNHTQVELYCQSSDDRQIWREENSFRPCYIGCSDGRVRPLKILDLPLGSLDVHQNIGGELNTGWTDFLVPLDHWYRYTVDVEKSTCLAMANYHFSKGHKILGCAGHKNDRHAAMAASDRLVHQLHKNYDKHHLYAVLIGLETDDETLIIHGPGGTLDLGDLTLDNLPLYPHVSQVLTDMPERVLVDFSRMLESNLRHSVEMRRTVRTHEKASHQEVGVIYGRSTDWATTPKVLKINPYPLDKKPPLAKAARLLWHTFKEANPDKRFPDEPFYLATTGVYYEADTNERLYAEDVAIALAEFAYDVMTRSVPSMKTCLEVVPGIVYHKDRSFTPIVDFKI